MIGSASACSGQLTTRRCFLTPSGRSHSTDEPSLNHLPLKGLELLWWGGLKHSTCRPQTWVDVVRDEVDSCLSRKTIKQLANLKGRVQLGLAETAVPMATEGGRRVGKDRRRGREERARGGRGSEVV